MAKNNKATGLTISSWYRYIYPEVPKEHPFSSFVRPTIFDLLNIEYIIRNKALYLIEGLDLTRQDSQSDIKHKCQYNVYPRLRKDPRSR